MFKRFCLKVSGVGDYDDEAIFLLFFVVRLFTASDINLCYGEDIMLPDFIEASKCGVIPFSC